MKFQATELEKVKKSVSFKSRTDKVIDEIIPSDSPDSIGDLKSLYWFRVYKKRAEWVEERLQENPDKLKFSCVQSDLTY